MWPPLVVCAVYVYKQFIQNHYIILSVSLAVEKWQLLGALADATRVCVFVSQWGKKQHFHLGLEPQKLVTKTKKKTKQNTQLKSSKLCLQSF